MTSRNINTPSQFIYIAIAIIYIWSAVIYMRSAFIFMLVAFIFISIRLIFMSFRFAFMPTRFIFMPVRLAFITFRNVKEKGIPINWKLIFKMGICLQRFGAIGVFRKTPKLVLYLLSLGIIYTFGHAKPQLTPSHETLAVIVSKNCA